MCELGFSRYSKRKSKQIRVKQCLNKKIDDIRVNVYNRIGFRTPQKIIIESVHPKMVFNLN